MFGTQPLANFWMVTAMSASDSCTSRWSPAALLAVSVALVRASGSDVRKHGPPSCGRPTAAVSCAAVVSFTAPWASRYTAVRSVFVLMPNSGSPLNCPMVQLPEPTRVMVPSRMLEPPPAAGTMQAVSLMVTVMRWCRCTCG